MLVIEFVFFKTLHFLLFSNPKHIVELSVPLVGIFLHEHLESEGFACVRIKLGFDQKVAVEGIALEVSAGGDGWRILVNAVILKDVRVNRVSHVVLGLWLQLLVH